MAQIAIVGPGAIGGTVAAWLAHSGHAVTLCARTPVDTLRVETPQGPIEARPRVLTDPGAGVGGGEPADWILVATKTYDCAAAAAWLGPLGGPGTRVAVLQNGVEHRARFAGLVEAERVVPAVVDIPAERSAPGRIVQRRFGSILVPDDAAGRDFAALFARLPIAVSTTGDFTSAAWRKLAVNCAGAVSALTLQPARVAHHPGAAEVMRALVRECMAVGRAEGATLAEALPDEVVEGYRAADPESLNSLHADRIAGRPMELDARNGVIVRLGARHGIDAPVNRMIVALISAAAGDAG